MKSVLCRHECSWFVFSWNKFTWVFLFALSLPLCGPQVWALDRNGAGANEGSQSDSLRQAQMVSTAFRETSRKVIPSVVKIIIRRNASVQNLTKKDKKKSRLPFGDFLPEIPDEGSIEGVGSGVLVDPSGIVLTNNHVIAQSNSSNITVELDDGRRVRVDSLKKDERSDLAVLTLEEKGGYPYLKFGNSDLLEIGDWVLAIGNPFMLESSVSAGIVSAKHRLLGKKGHGTYIQTDAAVNPGNSGGPLVNLKGEVVGINTAIASLSGGNQGIGFAIPSNTAVWVMEQLMKSGKVERAFLGASVERIGYEEGRKYGLPPRQGVRIGTLFKDTPAARAGLRNNDLILAFDGVDIDSVEALETMVESADVAKGHELTVLRDYDPQRRKIAIQLQIRPENYVAIPLADKVVERGKHYNDRGLGIMVIPLTPDVAKRFNYTGKQGVVVLNVMPGAKAWKGGLRDGMLITAVNGTPVPDIEVFKDKLKKASLANGILLEVYAPGNKKLSLTLKK